MILGYVLHTDLFFAKVEFSIFYFFLIGAECHGKKSCNTLRYDSNTAFLHTMKQKYMTAKQIVFILSFIWRLTPPVTLYVSYRWDFRSWAGTFSGPMKFHRSRLIQSCNFPPRHWVAESHRCKPVKRCTAALSCASRVIKAGSKYKRVKSKLSEFVHRPVILSQQGSTAWLWE